MEPEPTPPLPWEHKAAIGVLALLSLQEVHEGILFCTGQRSPGFQTTSAAFAILLLFYAIVGLGLAMRSRTAWWSGVLAVGTIALAHLSMTGPAIADTLSQSGRARSVSSYEWYQIVGRLKPFALFWLGTRNLFLFAVPVLLVGGHVRKTLIRDKPWPTNAP